MASAGPVPQAYTTPSVPSGSRIAAPHPSGHRALLPVGPAYLNHLRLSLHHAHSFSALDAHLEKERARLEALHADDRNADDDLGVGSEEEPEELLTLDPKEWKKQDHYAVLGLSHLRYKATPEQIKVANRKKVLKHHPDKKAAATTAAQAADPVASSRYLAGVNMNTNDDAFFKCIAKAHEVLTNPERRRQFDSVDPVFMELEEDMPTAAEAKNKHLDFFHTFTPVFDLYARFSRAQPVPGLGSPDASKADVEAFYDFWYNFDSWRSFEYLDKEANEGADSRDDKRYTEKKNKAERARRKKEDIARVRGLVDLALSLDPRIKRIKQEEKEARERRKREVEEAKRAGGKGGVGRKTKEEEEREKKEEEEKRKVKEEEDKVEREKAKKAKAAAATAAKKARRQQREQEEAAAAGAA